MKMRQFLSVVALTAATVVVPSELQAANPDWNGDIADIRVMDMAGKKFGERNKTSGEVCSSDNPVVAGEEVCIRLRMVVRNAKFVSLASQTPETWTFQAGSESSSVLDVPALGLRVGERNVWAEYSATGVESWQYSGMLEYDDSGASSTAYTYFTDFYFKYKVQPGDMGMPVKLLLSNLEPAGESRETNAYAIRYVNCLGSKFRIAARESSETPYYDANLYRFSPTSFDLSYPGTTYPLADYNLEKEGLYIKSIDFDKVNAEGGTWSSGDVWRNVYAGMSESVLTTPALAIQGGGKASDDIVVYVWSGNEEIMSPTGDDMRTITDENGKIRHVLAVHIAQGATGATFAMTGGVAKVGYATEIYMSPTLGPVYDMAGTPSSAYVTRQVKVVAAPEPTVKMTFENGETTHDAVVADADYTTAKCQLVFKVVPAASQDVTVKLTATVDGGSSLSALYNNNIIRIPEGSGFDIDGKIQTVTIPAGQTVTRSVYVLGASDSNPNTEGGVNFKIEKYGALFPSGVSVETTGHTMIINRLGDEGITFAKKNPDPASGAVSMSMGTSKTFKFQLNDSYANGKSAVGYHFYLVDHEDQNTVYAEQEGVVIKSGWLNFSARVNLTPGTYSADLYAVGPDGSSTAVLPYTIQVADAKKVVIAPTSGSYVIGEGEDVPFKFTLNTPYSSVTPKYVFLKTPNAADADYINTTLTNYGAVVDKDYKEVSVPQNVQFLDGTKGGRAITLNAFLGNNQSDPTDVDGSYNEGTVTITVTNKPPVLNGLTVAGIPATVLNNDGKQLGDDVPMGVQKAFKITSLTDVDADLNSDGFKVKWVIDGVEYTTTGNPIGQVVNHAFTSETPDGKQGQLVQVYLMDKDMGGVWPAVPNFQCYVKVRAKPYVEITTSAAGNLFVETAQNVGQVYVTLSDAPTAPIEVSLTVQKTATGCLKLRPVDGSVEATADPNVYTLKFAAGSRAKSIVITELDGTSDTAAGIDLNAAVTTTTVNADGVAWKDFYSKADPVTVRVENVMPTVIRPTQAEQQYTNETASANTPYKIYYAVSDVKADLDSGIDIDIILDGTSVFQDKVTDSSVHYHEVEFEGEGAHEVRITYTDKDGLSSEATVYYYVKQSKRLNLRAHGPAGSAGSSGGYSTKYGEAAGLGAGHVFAGDNKPQKVSGFVQSYSFNLLVSAVNAYAYGYKADPTRYDDGTLDAHDIGIDKDGNWNKSLAITEYYNYCLDTTSPYGRKRGAEGLDSFVYGWACNNTTESESSDSGTASFVLNIGESGQMAIPLPDGENSGSTDSSEITSIPEQFWEAVFSCEYLKSDNMGDINRDGIPDRYLMLYKFDVLDDTYTISGDDLRDLNFSADDDSVAACVEGDYLPAKDVAVYSSLIPGMPESWLTEGKAFTPILKIRGFPDSDYVPANQQNPSALNDAPHQLGLGYVSDQVYTNPKTDTESTLSYVEWLAWSEFKATWEAAHPGETAATTLWSPENPTNPTKADTDADGMTDGYEYYYWYLAHVGWVENYGKANEVHKRLTGRCYDPRNPGEGILITADAVAQAFNPNASSGDKTRDTDNDGLPDILEFELGTNPVDFDTDGDGLPDGWELCLAGLDPLTSISCADKLADGSHNYDGDAMAISSYQLEQSEQPVALDCEKAKRWTFAVVDLNGDTDGVQWYAMTEAPVLKAGNAVSAGWCKLTIGTNEYCVEKSPVLVDGRLACDTQVYKIESYAAPTDDGSEPTAEPVKGFPVLLAAGTVPEKIEENQAEELKAYVIESTIEAEKANACWIYGKGSTDALRGEVAETAANYGCLALARQKAVPAGAVVCAYPSEERDVAFLHFLCYQEFGFDPRTAWSPNSPLMPRWADSSSAKWYSAQGAYTGIPARTRKFSTYDEFLVASFFYNNEGAWPTTYYPTSAEAAKDETTNIVLYWAGLTTNPQGPEEPDLIEEDHYYGRNSDQGADTDLDGVPDGWELYVMAGPKKEGAYVFAPPYSGFLAANGTQKMDESYFSPFVDAANSSNTHAKKFTGVPEQLPLTELRKYAGTDSCNYYSTVLDGNEMAYSTTIVRPSVDAQWLNKFFPCDPWVADTDGDNIVDGGEGPDNSAAFIYGSPADDGKITSIPGGGTNPLSVDTDRDGLPDAWESRFRGSADSLYSGADAVYATDSAKNPIGNPLYGLTDGMDGTVWDAHNFSYGTTYSNAGIPTWGYEGLVCVVNRDYDHDGLDNWQEYLTGTMRCWRYDDPVSPLHGIPASTYYKELKDETTGEVTNSVFDAEYAAEQLGLSSVDEFWYKTLVDASSECFNPHFVTDTASGAQYFTRLENVWDCAYIDKESAKTGRSGAYYWFYDRANGQPIAETWTKRWMEVTGEKIVAVPVTYACCSPIDPDSDHDGMDDYYELFHGMNPLLGTSGVSGNWWIVGGSYRHDGEGFDIVCDSLSSTKVEAWGTGATQNFWQRLYSSDSWKGAKPRGTGFDFTSYPWLTGLSTADADGDGTRNQEEAIMPLVAPTTAWHHTDPTALWITDSSYSNSLVRTAYRLPLRSKIIPIEAESFTNGTAVYKFSDFDGFDADSKGLLPFIPDVWGVGFSQEKMNWIASFEENEGFDSDHDGINDQDEQAGKYRGQTDPINVDSPQRRQAMYFQGKDKPSILQTMPFVREENPDAEEFNLYPDDLSFLQYTVECWVRPDTLDDATILERAIWTSESNPADKEFLRCNFQLGLKGGLWYTKFDPNDTTKATVFAASDIKAVAGEWTHLAATYDGTVLTLYVNGISHGLKQSGLQPAYGTAAVAVNGMAGVHARPGMDYWRDREYKLHAILLGASFKTCQQGASDGSALDVTRAAGWDCYTNFFKGYVDEVRIWDGARTVAEIANDMNKRYTAEDVADNRDEFYEEWAETPAAGDYRGRYAKDGSGNAYDLPAELRFHWSFDSVFGAANENAVAKVPAGFNYQGETAGSGRAILTRPDNYEISWWKKVLTGYTGTIYNDPAWVTWVPNTVTHMPRFDGTTLDSVYWSVDFAGAQGGSYKFANTAEPVSFWTQYRLNGVSSGDVSYSSTGSRDFFVTEYDERFNTKFVKNYDFTGRHLNQTGDDMLALGGAFVKHVDDLWDEQGSSSNWEISGDDSNAKDGLPNWWINWANSWYLDDPDTLITSWDTVVVWPGEGGTKMTAGEAYLRDLARGYHADAKGGLVSDNRDGDFRQRYDLDANGIPDWWEDLYGVSGADLYADSDNDGLSNYVEYMLSEVFDFGNKTFSPVNARSADPYTLDYFYRIGSLYAGEIFTDHDLVEDGWEGLYEQTFGSRLLYDAYSDTDGDGWSNRSEVRYSKQCLPTIANLQTHYTASDGLVADYPIPTLSLTLNYNGVEQETIRKSKMVVQVISGQLSETEPDAEFVIDGASNTQAGTGTVDDKSTDNTKNSYTRTLGKWSNRHALGTLTPGYINKNSVALEFCDDPSAVIYNWTTRVIVSYEDDGSYKYYWAVKRGSRQEYDADRRKYGYANVFLVSSTTSYKVLSSLELRTSENSTLATWLLTGTGKILGTIDLTTGAFDLDLGVFEGVYAVATTNESDRVSLEDQSFRISYSVNPAVDLPRKFYLGQADTGYVREGKNTIVAFADTDNSGTFTPGEPYGIVRNVDVSWKGTSASIELTQESPVMPRIGLWTGTGDRLRTWKDSESSSESSSVSVYQEIRDEIAAQHYAPTAYSNALKHIAWMQTNVIEEPQNLGSSDKVRVRVVRWLVDGKPVWKLPVKARVLFDKTLSYSADSFLTEVNLLADEALDLDWQYLQSEVVLSAGAESMGLNVNRMDYLVVIGDGVVAFDAEDDDNVIYALPQVLTRYYGTDKVIPALVSPSATAGQTVRAASPTFVWTNAEEDKKGYTAFKVEVKEKNDQGVVVYDSGILPLPPRNSAGEYSWRAPLFAGDRQTNGIVYANNALYSWKVTMYNAKFRDGAESAAGTYLQCTQTNGLEYGTANVAVKYYGPKKSYADRAIRVRAYTSPDFTGVPVAAGCVAAPDDAETGVSVTGKVIVANCRLIGLPAGTYYLQAFIDSNNNGLCEPWESMGYYCSRDGSTSEWLNPVAMTFGDTVGKGDLATIYVEDADTDNDSLPDAWEWAEHGDLVTTGITNAVVTGVAELVVDKTLTGNFDALPKSDVNAGLSGRVKNTLASSASFAALASGLESGDMVFDANGNLVSTPKVEDGELVISDFAFDASTGKVTFNVSAETERTLSTAVTSPFYTVVQGTTVTVKVMQTESLAGVWKEVGRQEVTVVGAGAASNAITVDMGEMSARGGFFKVVVE